MDELTKTIFEIKAQRTSEMYSARRVFAALFFVFSASMSLFAQVSPPLTPKPNRGAARVVADRNSMPAEKSIAVDGKVNVRLCIAEGRLKINGWDHNEIRAFVAGGANGVGFKVLQKSKDNDNAVWVAVLSVDQSKNKPAAADECLSGDEIELDVPRGATVNVKSRESETVIDSVAKATVENVGGSIRLSRIAQGIEATTYEGDITVEQSGGAMSLATTTGNIIAFAVNPSDVGDAFKAKTNSGAIILRQIEYRQIEANSNSGAIKFAGEILSGGQYTFNAFNGSVNLQIPQSSSCRINASYGFGAFNSDITLTNIVRATASARAKTLTAQIGAADATLNLSTYSGTIQISGKR